MRYCVGADVLDQQEMRMTRWVKLSSSAQPSMSEEASERVPAACPAAWDPADGFDLTPSLFGSP